MHFVTLTFVLLVWMQIVTSEVNVPTFDDLLSTHCAAQCHGRPRTSRYRGRATRDEVNRTQVNEIVEQRLRIFEKSLDPESCRKVNPLFAKLSNSTGGVFNIYPLGVAVIEVYCDTTTDGGGWTVFQRRIDGSVDFNINWNYYVEGFGDRQGEFWLGLEKIHQLTRHGEIELRIDMIQTNGTYRVAKYESFSIGSSSDFYRLNVSGYSGNASDALSLHNNMRFTTRDYDRDTAPSTNCARYYNGAWWHHNCYDSHLNGVYGATNSDGIRWWTQEEPKSAMFLSSVEMKFRRKITNTLH